MTSRASPRELAYTSNLRVGAMAGVVLIHTLTAIVGNDEIRGTATWVVGTTLNRSLSWAVPLFVMVSGALLLQPAADQSPGKFYRRRIHRIGIPLVASHVGYFVLRAILGETLTVESVTRDLLRANVYTQLYFFWIILGMYLVTPLLRAFIASRPRREVLQLALGAVGLTLLVTIGAATLRLLGVAAYPWQPPMLMLWVPYVGYFLLGYVLRDMAPNGRAVGLALLAFVVGNAVTAWEFIAGRNDPLVATLLGGGYLGVPVVVATIALFVLGRAFLGPASSWAVPGPARRARALGDLTLGVFVVHMAVLRVFWTLVPAFGFRRDAESLPRSLALWASVLVISFALSALLARIPLVRRTIGL